MRGAFAGWPTGIKGAVSLSFDDAAISQLEHAIPIMNRYNIRGTFYVNPGLNSRFERYINSWKQAHEQGHEIGNHTIAHPCSGNFAFVGEERALELWSLERIEADVVEASNRLGELIPAFGEASFAYPCGQTYVGRGAARESYVPVIARHFRTARAVGESANDPRMCDLHALSSWMVEGLSGEELVNMLEPAMEAGHWAIYCFHGIGGDHIRIDAEPFEQLVSYLADHATNIWTDTVASIGRYLGERAHTDHEHSSPA